MRSKAVSKLSRLVKVVIDCTKESKTKESDDEMEIREEEVFL